MRNEAGANPFAGGASGTERIHGTPRFGGGMSIFAKPRPTPPPTPLAVSLEDACVMTALSIYTIRKEIKAGRLKTTRVGRRVLVPVRELERFVNGGPQADTGS